MYFFHFVIENVFFELFFSFLFEIFLPFFGDFWEWSKIKLQTTLKLSGVKLTKRKGRENYPKGTDDGDDNKKKKFNWTYFIYNESKHHSKKCHHHKGKIAKAMLIRMLIKKL